MKCQVVFPACLLLLWTLTASVSSNSGEKDKITVTKESDGIKVSCGGSKTLFKDETEVESGKLEYNDENTGEYSCALLNEKVLTEETKIFVKFRTCDNCIELDLTSIFGLVVGDVVATIVIGWAVYLVASQTRSGPIASHKKGSDRQHLVPNEVSNRGSSDHYQPLRHQGGKKETYDVLNRR